MRPDPTPPHLDRQAMLAAALLDGTAALPDGLIAPGGGPVGRRFAVHRATATLGSIAALAIRHPVLERLLGEETFADLARAFLRVDRPRTALLLDWGDGLAGFVAGHGDLVDWPWLADVARLEAAWTAALHAAEAEPIGLDALARLTPDDLATARLRLHPSLLLLVSRWSVAAVWAARGETGEVADATEHLLILRPDADVAVHTLDAAGFAFVAALADSATVAEAATAAIAVDDPFDDTFDPGAALVEFVRRGGVAAIEVCEPREVPT